MILFDEVLLSLPGRAGDFVSIWSTGRAVCCETMDGAEALAETLHYLIPSQKFATIAWPIDKNLWDKEHYRLSNNRDDECVGWHGVYLCEK